MKPPVAAAATPSTSNAGDQLNDDITAQGLKVRDLKSNKAEKAEVTAAVAILLDLKAKYKAAVGKDWKPDAHQPAKAKEPSPPKETSNAGDQLNEEITAQGLKVRDLKSNKAEEPSVSVKKTVWFQCELCDKSFQNKRYNLTRHIQISHQSKKYVCECQKEFTTNTALIEHKNAVQGCFNNSVKTKIHKCDFCEKIFKYHSNKYEHENYACNLNVNKKERKEKRKAKKEKKF